MNVMVIAIEKQIDEKIMSALRRRWRTVMYAEKHGIDVEPFVEEFHHCATFASLLTGKWYDVDADDNIIIVEREV